MEHSRRFLFLKDGLYKFIIINEDSELAIGSNFGNDAVAVVDVVISWGSFFLQQAALCAVTAAIKGIDVKDDIVLSEVAIHIFDLLGNDIIARTQIYN